MIINIIVAQSPATFCPSALSESANVCTSCCPVKYWMDLWATQNIHIPIYTYTYSYVS